MTPFATLARTTELEKEALAKGLSKGIGWVGNLIRRSGGAAKATAGRKAFADLGGRTADGARASMGMADRGAMKSLTSGASGAVGNKRMAVAGSLDDASKAITNSSGLQNGINYGGGAALAGAGLYGSNRMGHASGRTEGIGQGMDVGMEAGVQAAMANQQQAQPGYLGGLWNALKGNAGGQSDPYQVAGNAYGDLAAQRQQLIGRLMGQ